MKGAARKMKRTSPPPRGWHGQSPHTRRLYRSRNGRIFGVCRGIAEYFDFSVTVVRVLAIVGSVMTGIWTGVFAYLVAAMILKPEPMLPIETEDDAEFYNSYAGSRSMAIHRLKRAYDNLDRRIQRMETMVTAKSYDWERRLHED